MADSAPNGPVVLVVDDDPVLLALLQTILTRRDFRVVTAAGGRAAVALYAERRDEIDLVLLDVCMPGLDGPATLAELRRASPGVRACFMSGHTGRHNVEGLLAAGALAFFDKPFRIDHLTDELARLARPEALQAA